MAEKVMVICDLCDAIVGSPGNDKSLIFWYGNYQDWPSEREGLSFQVCKDCCHILYKALCLKLIDFDMDKIYAHSGFIKTPSGWTETIETRERRRKNESKND